MEGGMNRAALATALMLAVAPSAALELIAEAKASHVRAALAESGRDAVRIVSGLVPVLTLAGKTFFNRGKSIDYSLARNEVRDVIESLHRAFCKPQRAA